MSAISLAVCDVELNFFLTLVKGFQKTLEKLIASLICLELGDFDKSIVYGRRKYARFHELSLKIYEMKIQPVI